MDFIKILRSLEEFLYELMSWVIFYPRTFMRILRNPAAVAKYTQLQLHQPGNQQFTELVSPILMLILSVILAHVLEMASHAREVSRNSELTSLLFGSEQSLLATRSVIFSLYALIAAIGFMMRDRIRVDRDTLRAPFYIQSYLVSPFTVVGSASLLLLQLAKVQWLQLVALVFAVAITAWYVWARASVIHHLQGVGRVRSILYATVGFLGTTVLMAGLLIVAAL